MHRFFGNDPYLMGGLRVVSNPSMVEQFRYPRSKGKRIKKKWKKDSKNFRPSRSAMVDKMRGIVYCHPWMVEEIKRQIPQRVI